MKSLYRFCCFCFLLPTLIVSDSTDTITTNQPLADGKTIISSGGTFELGFYRPDVNSNRTYLGLWYKKVSKVTVVWTANRDVPINDTKGLLKVTDQANLTLFNGDGTAVWSSNATGSAKNPVAQLLDSGNLVIKDAADNNPENYLWQSFEHPTDTLLPGMKLGENLVKGTEVYMQSLKSSVDPSRGNFIFRVDPDGFPQQFLMNGSTPRFRTGPWNGLRFSWGSPGLQPNPLYTYEFVNNPQEIYYRYDLINTSVYSRLIISTDGIIQRFTWNNKTQDWGVYLNAPADTCDTYGLCNNYSICSTANSPICSCLDKFVPKSPSEWQATDWSNGCQRRVPLDCPKGDGFIKYSGIKLPDTRWSWYNRSMTLKECDTICLKNCSCTAYANTDITGKGSGCVLWFGDLIDMTRVNGGQDIYIRMAASEIPSGANKAKILGISLPLGGAFLLLVLSLILCARKKKRRQRKLAEQLPSEWKMESRPEQRLNTEGDKEDLDLPLFDLKTIEQATNNFSIDNKLGEGGFGPVYKGTLEEGQEIAVKRLSEYSIQGLDEFKNEVKCIAELQHRNLVKLLGCCIEGEEKMLIYEFMPNKSLDFFLFDNDRSRLLDWPKRFQIIIGIARGLLYLHQDSRLTIIHRDLKAGNILLDSAMKPKISDFGMARIFGGTETEASTKRVVGTYGYMSPEYAVDGVFSTKSDVFSFGVLVLEIVTGKKNRGFSHPDHHHNLLGHAWLLFKDGRFQELIDQHFSQSYCLSEVIRSIHVGLLCVQQYPDDRPSMPSVVLMLVGDGELPFPKEPGYFTERNFFFETDKIFSSGTVDSSGNQLSITVLEAR